MKMPMLFASQRFNPLEGLLSKNQFTQGACFSISTTARKPAAIIWHMVVKGVPNNNPAGYLFLDQKRKLGLVKRIKKQIDKFGLTNDELGISIC
jgi:transposase